MMMMLPVRGEKLCKKKKKEEEEEQYSSSGSNNSTCKQDQRKHGRLQQMPKPSSPTT